MHITQPPFLSEQHSFSAPVQRGVLKESCPITSFFFGQNSFKTPVHAWLPKESSPTCITYVQKCSDRGSEGVLSDIQHILYIHSFHSFPDRTPSELPSRHGFRRSPDRHTTCTLYAYNIASMNSFRTPVRTGILRESCPTYNVYFTYIGSISFWTERLQKSCQD